MSAEELYKWGEILKAFPLLDIKTLFCCRRD
jgi:hypothetical protein